MMQRRLPGTCGCCPAPDSQELGLCVKYHTSLEVFLLLFRNISLDFKLLREKKCVHICMYVCTCIHICMCVGGARQRLTSNLLLSCSPPEDRFSHWRSLSCLLSPSIHEGS